MSTYHNWGNCSNIDTTDSNLTSKLKRLCELRRAQSVEYANWIDEGKAWWFFVNLCSSNVRGNCVSQQSTSWENDPFRYPIPQWWWMFPEIPAPSIEWLSKCANTTGDPATCPTTLPAVGATVLLRRNTFMPPYNYTGSVPRRINLYDTNSWTINTSLSSSTVARVTIINENNAITYANYSDPVITVSVIRETFDNVVYTNTTDYTMTWLSCSIIIILIIICVYFFYKS